MGSDTAAEARDGEKLYLSRLVLNFLHYFEYFLSVFIQADGEQPSTSRSLDYDDDEPDDLSEPLSSTGSERPGLCNLII